MYLVAYSSCKKFLRASTLSQRMELAVEVINTDTQQIIKHRFAKVDSRPSMPEPKPQVSSIIPGKPPTLADIARLLENGGKK